jgi:hypothetical protein
MDAVSGGWFAAYAAYAKSISNQTMQYQTTPHVEKNLAQQVLGKHGKTRMFYARKMLNWSRAVDKTVPLACFARNREPSQLRRYGVSSLLLPLQPAINDPWVP